MPCDTTPAPAGVLPVLRPLCFRGMGIASRKETVSHVTADDMTRIGALLREVGGPNVSWGAQSVLDVWVAEAHMEAQRRASRQVLLATWALVIATLGLVVATVGLIVVG